MYLSSYADAVVDLLPVCSNEDQALNTVSSSFPAKLLSAIRHHQQDPELELTLAQYALDSDSREHMKGEPWDQNAAGVSLPSLVK